MHQVPAVTLRWQKYKVWSNCRQKTAFGTGKLSALDSSSFAFVPRAALDPCTGICLDRAGASQKPWKWRDFSHQAHSPPFQSITMKLNSHVTIKILAQDQIDSLFTSRSDCIRFNVGSWLKVSACCGSPAWSVPAYQLLGEQQQQQGNLPVEISLGLLHGTSHKFSGGKITVSFKSKFPACVNLNEIPFQESI